MALLHARALHARSFDALLQLFSCLDEHFVRRRVWGAMQVVAGVFALVTPGRAMSYQAACATVFRWAGLRFGWSQTPDHAGFARARTRVSTAEFGRVLDLARGWAQEQLRHVESLIPGRDLVAIDGTILHLPRTAALRRRFAIPKDRIGLEQYHYPQALLVSAWDVARRIPLAWTLSAITRGERELLRGILDALPAACVLIMDRGYPARDLLGAILASGRDLVVRMTSAESGSWPEVAAFLAGGKRSATVEVTVGAGRTRRTVCLRLVRRVFGPGRPARHQQRETMVILTSLPTATIDDEGICRVYAARWGVETIYREMKAVAEVERWHGRTPDLIEQELLALMLWFTIGAVFAEATTPPPAEGQERQRPNTRRVFDAVGVVLEALFCSAMSTGRVAELFLARADDAIRHIRRTIQRVRPRRSYARKALHPYARFRGNS